MRIYAVPFCRNKGKIKGIAYFRITQKRAQTWCKVINKFNNHWAKDACVCSEHFQDDDFEINTEHKKELKSHAIPSRSLNLKPRIARQLVFNLHTQSYTTAEVSRAKTIDTLSQDESLPSTSNFLVNLKINNDEHRNEIDNGSNKTDVSESSRSKVASIIASSDSQGLHGSPKKRRKFLRLMHTYYKSPRKLSSAQKSLEQKNKNLQHQLYNSRLKLRRMGKTIKHLKDVVKELKRLRYISGGAREMLQKSYSGIPQAIMTRMLKSSKRGFKIPQEIRNFAMTLQFYSSKAYNYVRETVALALPSPSTIRKWMTNVNCTPGFTAQAFSALEAQVLANKQEGKETICSLVMDEMAIKKQIDFINGQAWGYVDCGTNITDDELCLATEALVLLVVSLNNNWKMPIGYYLINSLTAVEKSNIVKEALCKLSEIGIKVCSITCDGPSTNLSMTRKLGAQIDNVDNIVPKFTHPACDSNLYVLFDVCHLLKLLRNAWATLSIFIDSEGNEINYQYILKLHEIEEEECLRFGTKLRKAHINWEKQKMKVNLAAQIFSNSVADALEFMMLDIKHPDFKNASATIKFLRLVDRTFDLLNSRNPFGKGPKAPLNKDNYNYWTKIFNQGIEFFGQCKNIHGNLMINTRNKTPFIGFLVAIKATMGIYGKFVGSEQSPLKYLLTYKLSQDHIELFFASIRSRNGWNNNPTAFQFYHTYKRLLNHAQIRNNMGNCISQDLTTVLPLPLVNQVINHSKIDETSVDEINLLKKYGMNNEMTIHSKHDYSLPLVPIGSLIDNVVAYIAGFVVRSTKKHLICSKCKIALETLCNSYSDDSCLKLVNRKTNGGLIKPSQDVLTICRCAEREVRVVLNITNNKMPNDAH